MMQVMKEKKRDMELNADLPKIPSGSLGSFRGGLQRLPLKVIVFKTLQFMLKLCVRFNPFSKIKFFYRIN